MIPSGPERSSAFSWRHLAGIQVLLVFVAGLIGSFSGPWIGTGARLVVEISSLSMDAPPAEKLRGWRDESDPIRDPGEFAEFEEEEEEKEKDEKGASAVDRAGVATEFRFFAGTSSPLGAGIDVRIDRARESADGARAPPVA